MNQKVAQGQIIMHDKEQSFEITVNNKKCRKCSYCIQICPAKAIKFYKDQVTIISERCIMCGSCITECPQHALNYKSGLQQVIDFIENKEKTIACIDPAFPAILDFWTPNQFVTVLKK